MWAYRLCCEVIACMIFCTGLSILRFPACAIFEDCLQRRLIPKEISASDSKKLLHSLKFLLISWSIFMALKLLLSQMQKQTTRAGHCRKHWVCRFKKVGKRPDYLTF